MELQKLDFKPFNIIFMTENDLDTQKKKLEIQKLEIEISKFKKEENLLRFPILDFLIKIAPIITALIIGCATYYTSTVLDKADVKQQRFELNADKEKFELAQKEMESLYKDLKALEPLAKEVVKLKANNDDNFVVSHSSFLEKIEQTIPKMQKIISKK